MGALHGSERFEPLLHSADLLGSEAFGNGELVLHDLAVDDRLDDIAQGSLLGEKILTSLELSSGIERKHRAEPRK